MANITHATPRNINLGVDDQSIKEIRPLDIMPILPQHLPLFFLFTQKGTYAKCIVDHETFDIIYGAESLRLGSKYYNHNAHMAKAILATGNSVVVKRMKPLQIDLFDGHSEEFPLTIDTPDPLVPTINIETVTGAYILVDGELVYVEGRYVLIEGVIYWVGIDGIPIPATEYVVGSTWEGGGTAGSSGTVVSGTYPVSYFEYIPGSIGNPSTAEGSYIIFEIRLGNIIEGSTIRFTALPGTATLGEDYGVDGFTYSIDGGDTWRDLTLDTEITVTGIMYIRTDTVADDVYEGTEYFSILVTVTQESIEYFAVGIASITDLGPDTITTDFMYDETNMYLEFLETLALIYNVTNITTAFLSIDTTLFPLDYSVSVYNNENIPTEFLPADTAVTPLDYTVSIYDSNNIATSFLP